MIRKYHNQPCEEPLNHHETSGRQIKQSNQLSLPHQDDCNTRTDTKQSTTKHRTITDSHNRSNNKQKVNNNRTTALERTAAWATRGVNAFYWYQIFALDSAVVEVQEMFSSHGGHLANTMYRHGETCFNQNFNILTSCWNSEDLFESRFFQKPVDRFYRDEANLIQPFWHLSWMCIVKPSLS